MRRRGRGAPAAEVADDVQQSFQDEALALVSRSRGRGRGRPQLVTDQEIGQEYSVEPVAPEEYLVAFIAGLTLIN